MNDPRSRDVVLHPVPAAAFLSKGARQACQYITVRLTQPYDPREPSDEVGIGSGTVAFKEQDAPAVAAYFKALGWTEVVIWKHHDKTVYVGGVLLRTNHDTSLPERLAEKILVYPLPE